MKKAAPLIPIRTLLLVVEGEGEKAFCLYLKEFLRGKGVRVSVENAHGGSPDVIVAYAARLCRHAAYGQVAVLMDADKTLTATGKKTAKSIKAQLILSRPCLEGEVLRLLGQSISTSATTADCEAHCAALKLDKSTLVGRETWRTQFPLEQLQTKRTSHAWLEEILALLGL